MTTTPHGNDDEIVNFPVHRRHLGVVVQAVADAFAAESNGARRLDLATRASTAVEEPWTKQELARLHRDLLDRLVPRTMMKMAFEQPGTGVPFTALCERAGVSKASARAGLAQFGRLLRAKYGRTTWPLSFEFGAGGDGEDYVYYVMDQPTAEMWAEIAG